MKIPSENAAATAAVIYNPFAAKVGWRADGWDLVRLVKGFHLDRWPFGLRHHRNAGGWTARFITSNLKHSV